MSSFNDLKLSDTVLKAIAGMGFEEATHIQEQAIPLALKGADIIGQAQTGTGKTAAFGIPMIEKLDNKSGEIQGIVITPTRELAIQVAEEINRIGQTRGIHALPIYGGQDYRYQMQGLRNKPQIIVGTPGRLVDHHPAEDHQGRPH
jgi:ATP-dependent RNA helicase DeaD